MENDYYILSFVPGVAIDEVEELDVDDDYEGEDNAYQEGE